MPNLREKSMKQIERHFPTSLAESQSALARHKVNPLACDDVVHAISVARETGAQWILPMAFYVLCRRDTIDIFDIFDEKYCAQLSREDLRVCMQGRDALSDAVPNYGPANLTLSDQCINREYDMATLTALQQKSNKRGVFAMINGQVALPSSCIFCIRDTTASANARREEAWGMLPGWFGLPSWAEMLAARTS